VEKRQAYIAYRIKLGEEIKATQALLIAHLKQMGII
jgi:hypothetical protein